MKKSSFIFLVISIFLFSNASFAQSVDVSTSTTIGAKEITDTNYNCLYYPTTTKIATFKGTYKIAKFENVMKKFRTKRDDYKKKYQQAKNKSRKQKYKKLYQKFNKALKETKTCKNFNTAQLACENFKLQVDVNDSRITSVNKKINTKVINGGKCDKDTSSSAKITMTYKDGSTSSCTGTPIKKDVILTAAHCLEDEDDEGPVVAVKVKIGGETYQALSWLSNPHYEHGPKDRTEYGDTALVWLSNEIPYMSVPLVSKDTTAKANDVGAIAGYGITEFKTKDEEQTGFKSGFVVISKIISSGIYSNFKNVYRQSNTCQGDSGGAFLVYQSGEWRIFGVTSWGDDDECGFFSKKENSWWSKITSPENVEFIEGALGDIYSKD